MIGSIQPCRPAASQEIVMPRCGASPEARLLAVMVYSQLVQGQSAETSIKLNEQQLRELRAQVREAIEAAREANEDSGFWGSIGDALGGDVASLAQVVAVAAACVATGGTAALVLAAIAIGCTLASKYADELGIPQDVAIGIGIAGAVAAVAAGNVGAGASLAGAASGTSQVSTGAAQVSQLAQVAAKVKFTADIGACTAQFGAAGANTVSGYYGASAIDYKADARESQSVASLRSFDIDEAIDQLEQAVELQVALFDATSAISQANQRTSQLIVSSFMGAA